MAENTADREGSRASQSPGILPAAGRSWLQGPRCQSHALEQLFKPEAEGQRPFSGGAALPGRAGTGRSRRRSAGLCRRAGAAGAAGARPGCAGEEALGCTTNLVPAGAALPPPPASSSFSSFIYFIYFIAFIYLYSPE